MVSYHCVYKVLLLWVCVLFYPANSNDVPGEALQEIRQKWGAAEIVRDLEHIRDDVSKMMKLQEKGEISANEALFYFLRMHDFDDNGELDGHELMAAVRHSFEHSQSEMEPMKHSEIEAIVDSFFNYDENSDGFISYTELRRNLGDMKEP